MKFVLSEDLRVRRRAEARAAECPPKRVDLFAYQGQNLESDDTPVYGTPRQRRTTPTPRGIDGRLSSAPAKPELLDVAVGHAGDVVGDRAGQPLGWNLCLVVGGKKAGVGHQN